MYGLDVKDGSKLERSPGIRLSETGLSARMFASVETFVSL
jgi:hypothetical protein